MAGRAGPAKIIINIASFALCLIPVPKFPEPNEKIIIKIRVENKIDFAAGLLHM
ncbi:MAG: hypothetical protein AseanaTS_21840 [Candidatus Pelagadaptatus aseana]